MPYRQPLGANQRPIASVRPMMSTPIPMQARNASGLAQGNGPPGTATIPVSSLLRPGVTVHQIQTTTGKADSTKP